jgi:intracellular sulfur oxidation DsrE/DsrF family protein
MKIWWMAAAAIAVLLGPAGAASAQSPGPLLVPGVGVENDVPGAHELPDPDLTYKVVFDVVAAAPAVGDRNPGLVGAARYLNTLAKYGVPAERRQIAVVLHRGAAELILDDAAFSMRNDGHDNPNIALIQDMKKAGVDLRVCGQAVLAREMDPETILPEIQVDLWALTTLTTLELQGYVRVGP